MKKIKERIWAIIPARSGSKGLKEKNIKILNNKPLIYYTIKDAKNSNMFEKIFVLTDSPKFAKIAKKYGAEIPYLRSKENSKDSATDNDIYVDLFKFFKRKKISLPNYFAHLCPTLPIRSNDIIKKGINYFFLNKKKGYETMRSVSEMTNPSYKTVRIVNKKLCSILKKDFDLNKLNGPRQSYEKTYVPNGLIDIIDAKCFLKRNTTHGKKVMPFIVNQIYVDIHDKNDLAYAKYLLNKK